MMTTTKVVYAEQPQAKADVHCSYLDLCYRAYQGNKLLHMKRKRQKPHRLLCRYQQCTVKNATRAKYLHITQERLVSANLPEQASNQMSGPLASEVFFSMGEATHRCSQGGQRGHGPFKFLENIVILCFAGRFSKQNGVIRLNQTFCPPKISGLAMPLRPPVDFYKNFPWGGAKVVKFVFPTPVIRERHFNNAIAPLIQMAMQIDGGKVRVCLIATSHDDTMHLWRNKCI